MRKTTEQFAAELKSKHNIILISEYLGAHSKISFLCENRHENEGTATNVLQRGYKCKECKEGRKIISKISWNDTSVQRLKSLVLEGLETEDIAKEFNTTVAAINNAFAKFDIENKREHRTHLRLLEVLDKQERTLLSDPSAGAKGFVSIQCKNGHTTKQQVSNVIYHNVGCPDCFKAEPSNEELEILNFIKANYSGWVVTNDRKILDGQELDIVLPDLGLAIEYNGTYWHSKVPKYYHRDKTNAVEDFGYQLIHINSHTYSIKKDIVLSKLLNRIKPQKRIGARLTIKRYITYKQAEAFLNKYHIQGATPSKYNYGLFYNDELVAVATYSTPRFDKSYDLELIRFASNNVTGALGKMLPNANIITYAQRDWSNGNLYKKLGFTLLRTTEPNYAYYKRDEKLSRYQAQKHLLKNMPYYDESKTEEEILILNGYHKVYDAGNLVFTLDHQHL